MTRQEEVEACITTLQNRILIKAYAMPTYSEGDTRLKYIRRKCRYLKEDLEDVLGYIKELEELQKQ